MPFNRPKLADLLSRTEAELAARLGLGPLLPRSVLAVLARLVAGQSHLLHAHVGYAVDQVFPDTADADNLVRIASRHGILRKAALSAFGPVVFTGTEGTTVPQGTLVRRVDDTEYSVAVAGDISGGSVSLVVRAVVAELAGDTVATTVLTLVSPVSGIDTNATVDTGGIVNGADVESDANLLERLLQRLQTPPQGGAQADYVKWALEIAEVTRAFALPQHFGPGTVGVTFLVDDDPTTPIPDAAKVLEVQEYIDDPTRRPVTAAVTVFAPVEVQLDPEIILVPDTTDVRAAVTASLEDMLKEDAAPGGTILLSRIREAISTAQGETDHTLVSPVADVTTLAGEIPTLGTITWS